MSLAVLKKVTAISLFGLGLGSCETTVTLPEPAHTPRIALLYTLSNQPTDTTSEVLLSRLPFVSYSQRVFDTKSLSGRADATIEVSDASGTVVERFVPGYPRKQYATYYGRSGYYTATMGLKGQPGQVYTLRATLPGFEPVESTLSMPIEPVINEAAFVVRSTNNQSGTQVKGRLSVTLTDNAATADYYVVFARILDKAGKPVQNVYLSNDSDEEILDFQVGRFELSDENYLFGNNLQPYADTDVNGKQFTLSTNIQYYLQGCYGSPTQPTSCPEAGYLELRVSNMTADAYRFYQSSRNYYDTQDNPFAEPAPLASNLKSGYGLFGGASDATYRIKLF